MAPRIIPHDDLAALADQAWERLERAAVDPGAPFRRMQVATLGAQGWPELRTVILREADAAARRVAFHTDARSAKAGEIAADGRVSLHFWDARAKLQLRLWGQAQLQTGSAPATRAWKALSTAQRGLYAGTYPPGRALEDPGLADAPRQAAESGRGRKAFALVEIRVARFEWLHLRAAGHRRARFDWKDGWQGQWRAP